MPTDSQPKDQESSQEQSAIIERVASSPIGSDKIDDPKEDQLSSKDRYTDIDNKDGFSITYTIGGFINAGSLFIPQHTASFGQFFVAFRPCRVVAISEVHNVAGVGTLQVQKILKGAGINYGNNITTSGFNVGSMAATPVTKSNTDLYTAYTDLDEGDSLNATFSSGPSASSQSVIAIIVHMVYLDNGHYKIQ